MAESSSSKRKRDLASDETLETGLQVDEIFGLEDENHEKHHTDDYESNALILRRGDSFLLDVTLKVPRNDEDNFHLEFLTVKHNKRNKPVKVFLEVGEKEKTEWSYRIIAEEDRKLRLSVSIPANALVSRFSLTLVSVYQENKKRRQNKFAFKKDVFILFNPWCEDDEVYMEDENLKKEYILNDSGYVYWSGCRPKPWYFGQFTDAALECTFKLLEEVHPQRRDTAREVCRHMSAMANSLDNNGLLTGNWSGNYEGGVKPWEWNGSVRIFKKYLETGVAVNYGQCWVFSGLMTSMMRALGIPTRSVTNYDSAHDTDNNCTFDKYFDEDMNYLEDDSDDSCWNFHVWNDVWMSRPDLSAGMGGWQAIDGTPQEESRGIHRCGPASLQAIKEGNVNLNYDTKFVFAEVNADKVFWKKTINSRGREDWEPVRIKTDAVGRDISTKMPNIRWRQDVTQDYKHKEGSLLERAAVKNAMKKTRNPALGVQPKDVEFSSKLPYEVSCDSGVELVITAKNTSSNAFTVESVVTAQLVRYTGVTLKKMKKQKQQQRLSPNTDVQFLFHYEPSEYLDEVDENVVVRLSFMTRVLETDQVYVNQKVCTIQKPELSLELVGLNEAKVHPGDQVNLKIAMPMVCSVSRYTKCTIELEGSILDKEIVFAVPDHVGKEMMVIEKSFVVKKNVKKNKILELVASFNSAQLSGITAAMEFRVEVS